MGKTTRKTCNTVPKVSLEKKLIMKKFLCIFDAHEGYELKRTNGKLTKRFSHDQKALNAVLNFAADFQPDVVILGGDNMNMGFISRHTRSKPRLIEGLRAEMEYDLFNTKVLEPIENYLKYDPELVYMKGNHEAWVDQFLEENPTIEGLIEPENYLQLVDRDWKIIDYGGVYKLGKLHFAHGDNISASVKQIAAKALDMYQRNIVTGHRHTAQIYVSNAMADMDPHISYVIPTLSHPDPDYVNQKPTNWVKGFGYGYVADNGNFNLYPVIITKGRFIAEGLEYRG